MACVPDRRFRLPSTGIHQGRRRVPPIEKVILVGAILILLSIVSSKLSARFGVPVLVLFLGLGMLAGSEGIGGIEFENYAQANAVGTVALALILFDGGLSTPAKAVRLAWKPSFLLATVGVLLTAVVTGLAASWILGVGLLEGLLLGGIVGSTDAAAVFAALRSGGVRLSERLGATLELESGANDPMAIFLTVGLLEVLTGGMEWGPGLLGLFALQMGLGAAVGLGLGFVAAWLINRIDLDSLSLYPIFASALGLLSFGATALLGGSGFLAIYLTGIVLGNRPIAARTGIIRFHNTVGWLAQIVMFVVLGLLSFPSQLWNVADRGLMLAAILILVARPLAVLLTLAPFRFGGFHARELIFLSWVGLKGAVPITLATFPFFVGLPEAPLLFNVVFFIVLVSALGQGWTLPALAARLGLQRPLEPSPPVTLEISSFRHVDGEVMEYTIAEDSAAVGKAVRDLALPNRAVIALIARGRSIIPPQGSTRVQAGDHLIFVLDPETRPLVDAVFARRGVPETLSSSEIPLQIEFPLRGSTTVGQLRDCYGLNLDAADHLTLDEAIRHRLQAHGVTPALGEGVVFESIRLSIRELGTDCRIEQVGMMILPNEELSADQDSPPRSVQANPDAPEDDLVEATPSPEKSKHRRHGPPPRITA